MQERLDTPVVWGQCSFSPPVQHVYWGFQKNGTYTAYAIFMHLSNGYIPVFGDIHGQVVDIDDEELY
jgi:hypothetical protein